MTGFPLPGMGHAVVAVPAPGDGPGYWAGASCAVPDSDGSLVVGYRVRNGHDGIDQTVIARSPDGETFTTVATLDQSRFGARWMERPAVVRTEQGRWRLYVCCGTPETKRWWIEVLEADDPAGFETAEARPSFPGDERTAVKDPIVRLVDGRWHAWICCHPLDVPGAEDRMSSAYATSDDGLEWEWHGTVLTGRPGAWDARGPGLSPSCRTAAPPMTAARLPRRTGSNAPVLPIVDVRYLDVLPLGDDGGYRIWYEARLPDESHELRTEVIRP
jgi:hypothetical protein